MHCRHCGAEVPDGVRRCPECGGALENGERTGGPAPQIRTYLVPAILSAIFCCQPLGIVAIVFAAISMSNRDAGRYDAAMQAAEKARFFFWLAFWLMAGIYLITGVLMVAMGVLGSVSS